MSASCFKYDTGLRHQLETGCAALHIYLTFPVSEGNASSCHEHLLQNSKNALTSTLSCCRFEADARHLTEALHASQLQQEQQAQRIRTTELERDRFRQCCELLTSDKIWYAPLHIDYTLSALGLP